MKDVFLTIGHSNRPIETFVGMLQEAEVRLIVDVRTVRRSRANPQYNGETLAASLAERAIGYEFVAELGGLRGRQRGVTSDVNAFWDNETFHNYADYAMSREFAVGLSRLCELGHARCCAIMCAEAVWWRCHRRIIADYLIATGETVRHIVGPRRIEEARMTSAARRMPDGTLAYPAADR